MVNFKVEKRELLEELVQADLKLGSVHYRLLDHLLQTSEDIDKFMEEYYTGKSIRDIERYRRFKRSEVQMTKKEWNQLKRENKKRQALEVLFQEPISDSKLEVVQDFDLDHLYTLSQRYKFHTLNSITKMLEVGNINDKITENETDFLCVG